MTRGIHDLTGRRRLLKRAGVTLATLGGMASSAAADGGSGNGERRRLADPAVKFTIYWSGVDETAGDPDAPGEFGFPDGPPGPDGGPFFGGTDPGGGAGLFDGRDIEISPNERTLHHSLRFFAGLVMEGKAKPYSLVNLGGGLFESRGQTTNFEARSADEIEARLTRALTALGLSDAEAAARAEQLAGTPPLGTLAGGRWRAVASERLQVDLGGDPPYTTNWSATRVDFYSRGGGKPGYTLSLIYTIWLPGDAAARRGAVGHSRSLVTGGRLNSGGQ